MVRDSNNFYSTDPRIKFVFFTFNFKISGSFENDEGKSKGACYGAPRGPGAHRIRGPCGSHSQPPSHWQQYSTGGLILRILNRRLDLNNRLREHTVCTYTRAANFTCRAVCTHTHAANFACRAAISAHCRGGKCRAEGRAVAESKW